MSNLPAISSDIIEQTVTDGQAITLYHGLGREAGWLVAWRDAVVDFIAQESTADKLVLLPSGSGNVRIVLL